MYPIVLPVGYGIIVEPVVTVVMVLVPDTVLRVSVVSVINAVLVLVIVVVEVERVMLLEV